MGGFPHALPHCQHTDDAKNKNQHKVGWKDGTPRGLQRGSRRMANRSQVDVAG